MTVQFNKEMASPLHEHFTSIAFKYAKYYHLIRVDNPIGDYYIVSVEDNSNITPEIVHQIFSTDELMSEYTLKKFFEFACKIITLSRELQQCRNS